MQNRHRRRFLMAVLGTGGLAGIGAATGLWRRMAPEAAGAPPSDGQGPAMERRSYTSRALGTQVTIVAIHARREVADRAIRSAFDQLHLVERLMSIYRQDSQLVQLNRDKQLTSPHRWLVQVLRAAADMSKRSQGAFDITVQPLWDLYADQQERDALPDESAIARTLKSCDWRQVEIGGRTVRLRGRKTSVTLNGIAQGFAADRAVAALREHGIEQALIDTGEIASIGQKQEEQPWGVGIQHPRHQDQFLAVAHLDGRCLATSGDYATTFRDDRTEHHLFDPLTGHSPGRCASVSIAAPTGMLADALSTAVFVMGPERGLQLVAESPGCDALLVEKNGKRWKTDGFPC